MTSHPARGIRSRIGATDGRTATRTYRLREGDPAPGSRTRQPLTQRYTGRDDARWHLSASSLDRERPSRTADRQRVPPPLRDKWRWLCSASTDTGSWRNGACVVSRYSVETRASECDPFDASRRRLSPDRQLRRADPRPPDRRHPGEPDPRADRCVLTQPEYRALNARAAATMIASDSERLLRMLHPGTACDPVTHHEQLRESSRLAVLRTHSAVAPSHRCFGLGGVGST